MPKLSLTDLTNLQNEQSAVAAINANFAAIEAAIENTLSRNGTSPNTMGANLDMDGRQILNLAAATAPTHPIRKAEFDAATGDLSDLTGLVAGAAASANAASVSANAAAASAQAAQDALDDVLEGSVADNAITNSKMADNSVGTVELINSSVTNAKMADMAQGRVKGRGVTSGTGAPTDLTGSQVLDMVGSTQGMLPVRGATEWTGLAIGTAGQVLAVGGSTNLEWTTPTTVPAGSVIMYAGGTVPSGWLECNGASVSRATYSALFTAISTTFGSVDGSTFNLPDCRGVFVRGFDNGRGTDPARSFGSIQAYQVGPHTHTASSSGSTSSDGAHTHSLPFATAPLFSSLPVFETTDNTGAAYDNTGSSGAHTHTLSISTTVNSNGGTESRPVNIALRYIIKT